MQPRAFINDQVTIGVRLHNRSALPVPWLHVRDGVPVEIGANAFHQAITLGPHETRELQYSVHVNRRGRYRIGPLSVYTGDVLGLTSTTKQEGRSEWLTVYPKIVPLAQLGLPSRSPLGSLREIQPIFEDPSRVRGKRDYVGGDSLRRVDWKTSAVLQRLQVKQFEPSIALEAMLFLDQDRRNYDRMTSLDDIELAIVVAASLANWIVSNKESVGLVTNGLDPQPVEDGAPGESGGAPFEALPPRKGRGHFSHLLEVLARTRHAPADSDFAALIRRERVKLSWGTTLIAITGQMTDALLEELLQAQRRGLNGAIVLCGRITWNYLQHKARAARFGIQMYHVPSQRDWNLHFE
jgi:uncharacterized protein (DUF58 family)